MTRISFLSTPAYDLHAVRTVLLIVQGFLAVNAITGGLLLMRAPDGSLLALPRDFMHTALFADFFWPGAILFGVLGLGHLLGFILTLRRSSLAAGVALALGAGTLTWIGVQMLMTDLFWLQGLIAGLGLVEVVAGRRKS